MKPLPLEEREFRKTILRLERRAIIPLKWIVFLVTAALWTLFIERLPDNKVFMLFLAYFLLNCAQTYFYFFSNVTLAQVKPFALFSYLIDIVFVSALVYFDLATDVFGLEPHPQFYVLYFLLAMRGFALLKTVGETIFVNALISMIFILTVRLQKPDFSFIMQGEFAITLALVWLVILMSWFIVMVITQQKNELIAVQERLMRADSLARVGEIAAGVAHEINNPIGIIAATADYLKMKAPGGSEDIEELDAIQREAMRCKEIVQEMLDYANPRSAGTMPVDPRALNDEVTRFVFGRRQSGNLVYEAEYADNPGLIEVDANLFKQALLNIYINARQAIPEDRPGRIVTRIAGKGARATIEIEDNGVGISPEEIDVLFEPFFTKKSDGTGLGLAIAQRIVETFGGDIAAQPAPRQGAVFTLSVPRIRS